MSQIEKQGLIRESSNRAPEKLGPSKTEYELTAQGERTFETLLKEALKNINLIELSAGIAFMEYLPRQRAVVLLKQRVEAQRQIPAFLQTLSAEDIPSTPSKHPELLRVWADAYTDAAASTEKLIASIQSGKYVFKNEEV